MDHFDIVIVGAGPGGEAAAYKARELGASVAVVERDLVGGSCPFWGCVPSKSLLHGAARHAAGAAYTWADASARRDYMINREGIPYPDDGGHVRGLEAAGATVVRGAGKLAGPGRVQVERHGARRELSATASSSRSAHRRRSRGYPGSTRSGRGPTARRPGRASSRRASWCSAAARPASSCPKLYARFGVPTTIVHSRDRLLARDHARNAEAAREALLRDGVTLRLGVRAVGARPGAGADGADVLDLADGTTVEGHAILLAVGRTIPLANLGLETVGIDASQRGALPSDGRLRVADGLFVIGDARRTRAAHAPGALPGRNRGADGAR